MSKKPECHCANGKHCRFNENGLCAYYSASRNVKVINICTALKAHRNKEAKRRKET